MISGRKPLCDLQVSRLPWKKCWFGVLGNSHVGFMLQNIFFFLKAAFIDTNEFGLTVSVYSFKQQQKKSVANYRASNYVFANFHFPYLVFIYLFFF